MAVQRLPQPLLVERVPDQPDRPREHEQAVEVPDADDLADFLLRKHAARPEEVEEQRADAAVDVEDEVGGLCERVFFDLWIFFLRG